MCTIVIAKRVPIWKIQNPLATAMDVHYVVVDEHTPGIRTAPRRALHVAGGDCADVVVQSSEKHLYLFDFSFPALNWKQETTLGTGRFDGLSGIDLEYAARTSRGPKTASLLVLAVTLTTLTRVVART